MKKFSISLSQRIVSALRPAAYLGSAALLSACAGLTQQPAMQSDDAHHARDAARAALSAEKDLNGSDTTVSEAKKNLPDVKLTDELFYKILTSEIAYQRGSWQAAYVTLMSTAQQTRDPRLARRSTEIALSVKQPSEALAAIRLWRELSPDSNEATQYYLGFMVMNNNLAEIRSVYEDKLSHAEPAQRPVLMLQAQRMLARARDKKASFDVLEELLNPYKEQPEAHLALAQGAYSKGDNARAVSEARQVLASRPDSQLAILTIAQASPQQSAIKELAAFLDKNPDARDVRLARASILIDLKQYGAATAEFERLLRDNPNDLNSQYTLGVLAMEANQLKLAENYFHSYLNQVKQPGNERDTTSAYLNLARIALERKDYDTAQNWLAQVNDYDGSNSAWFNVQLRRAGLYARSGKLENALAFLKQIKTSSSAETIQIVQTEAQLLRDNGAVLQAGQVLRDAIKAHPDSADLMYDYAMLLESQGNINEMESYLRQVIKLEPNSQHAYNALGYSLADRNMRLDEALALIEKANALAPDDPFILDSLGWVKFRLAKPDEAEKALRRAYELRNEADIAAHLGEVLWSAGHKEEALRIWREAARKDGNNDTLKTTLERFKVKP